MNKLGMFHFKSKTVFLAGILAFSIISGMILTFTNTIWLRLIFGVPSIFLIPGFLLTGILWPKDGDLEPLWRVTLIIPGSIALVGLILLSLNYFWNYKFTNALMILTIVNACLLGGFFVRTRNRASYLNNNFIFPNPSYSVKRDFFSLKSLLLTIVVLFFLGSITYTIITHKQDESLTEFYILNSDRTLPLVINSSNPTNNFIVGVFNHARRDVIYTLLVQENTDKGFNKLLLKEFTVNQERKLEINIALPELSLSSREVEFLLFREYPQNKDPQKLSLIIRK